jgi:hypothetical protein
MAVIAADIRGRLSYHAELRCSYGCVVTCHVNNAKPVHSPLTLLTQGGVYSAGTAGAAECFQVRALCLGAIRALSSPFFISAFCVRQIEGPCPTTVKPDPIATEAYQGGSKVGTRTSHPSLSSRREQRQTPPSLPSPSLQARITMLKNEDHWPGSATAGNFTVALWNPAGQATLLGSISDSALPSLTTYSVDVLIPKVPSGNYTIQARARGGGVSGIGTACRCLAPFGPLESEARVPRLSAAAPPPFAPIPPRRQSTTRATLQLPLLSTSARQVRGAWEGGGGGSCLQL